MMWLPVSTSPSSVSSWVQDLQPFPTLGHPHRYFDLLIIDDLRYLPQGAEESEMLFTLIAERYVRLSLGITSNLVFSEWEKIFANPMATAAAIDRIVHHSVILEFDLPSYRTISFFIITVSPGRLSRFPWVSP